MLVEVISLSCWLHFSLVYRIRNVHHLFTSLLHVTNLTDGFYYLNVLQMNFIVLEA